MGGQGDDDRLVGRELASQQDGPIRRVLNYWIIYDPRQKELLTPCARGPWIWPPFPAGRRQHCQVNSGKLKLDYSIGNNRIHAPNRHLNDRKPKGVDDGDAPSVAPETTEEDVSCSDSDSDQDEKADYEKCNENSFDMVQ